MELITEYIVGEGMIHEAIHKFLTLPFITLMLTAALLVSCVEVTHLETGETTPQEEAAVQPPAWQNYFSPDSPYYNNTVGRVNVRTGPGIQFRKIGFIPPSEGGYIQGCNEDFEWCQISYNDNGDIGWVKMEYVGEGTR